MLFMCSAGGPLVWSSRFQFGVHSWFWNRNAPCWLARTGQENCGRTVSQSKDTGLIRSIVVGVIVYYLLLLACTYYTKNYIQYFLFSLYQLSNVVVCLFLFIYCLYYCLLFVVVFQVTPPFSGPSCNKYPGVGCEPSRPSSHRQGNRVL